MSSKRLWPKRIKYEITQDDIDQSTPTCENCPHARALKRYTGSDRVRVYGSRVSIGGSDAFRYYYSTPSYTHEFEVARDQVGRDACTPGFAVINYINRKKISPSSRQTQINKNRRQREAMLRATGDTVFPYRTRTGTATNLVPAA